MTIPLTRAEDIIDGSGVALRTEALLPIGARHRQLKVRTLLAGMMLTQADRRPACLTKVHRALIALPGPGQARPGVTGDRQHGPHQLTYRQVERTFGLAVKALGKDKPAGAPSDVLASVLDDLLEASIPAQHKDASTALAADWTDMETFRPPRRGTSQVRRPRSLMGAPHQQPARPPGRDVLRFLPTGGHHGPRGNRPAGPGAGPPDDPHLLPPRPSPRPGRRPDPHAPGRHPPRRHPGRLRLRPPRRHCLGHPAPPGRRPADPGPAPKRPRAPRHPPGRHHRQRQPTPPRQNRCRNPDPSPHRHPPQVTTHDQQAAELSRHKLGRISADGPTATTASCAPQPRARSAAPPAKLDDTAPRPPGDPHPARAPASLLHPQTITVPPEVAAKTRQKHDYPSPQHRRSYARRTAAERTFSTIKDPATTSVARGWCRLMGVTPLALWLACLLTVRNQRILSAWDARQEQNTHQAAARPQKTRKRRRQPSPASPPDRHNPCGHHSPEHDVHHQQASQQTRHPAAACRKQPRQGQQTTQAAAPTVLNPATDRATRMPDRNVKISLTKT